MTYRHRPTLAELRRELVGDSVTRARLLTKFVQLIREDERDKVLTTMRRKQDQASADR